MKCFRLLTYFRQILNWRKKIGLFGYSLLKLFLTGDFLEAYGTASQEASWDCVVTCFFIDCANNIITYLERIFHCIKEGGTWINLGPLLYHYSDLSDENSIEPPFDFLADIIEKIGFVIEVISNYIICIYTTLSQGFRLG